MARTSDKHSSRGQAGPPGSLRIIAGKWRRRRLPIADRAGLRPTPDRVRETLFAWLAPVIAGSRCLDLFAGSGALGFEAASRGANRVVMVERERELIALLEQHRRRLSAEEVEIVAADALGWMERQRSSFDIIFLDPPFGEYELTSICRRIEENGLLAPSGFVYLETNASAPQTELPAGWATYRSQRAGQVRYDLARKQAPGANA
ncbi:MAG: 16S rRNA (guanine(966)-N(2))-methyltransferase RsmD [Gammaproteobacteria bacterium]|nr:16S rRNA (guanine(966)-N(2))-methyltransferase RsmD [Gammaproteobacteria bacterium]